MILPAFAAAKLWLCAGRAANRSTPEHVGGRLLPVHALGAGIAAGINQAVAGVPARRVIS
jgi:hypothetical protein